jgi:hypothetical protein
MEIIHNKPFSFQIIKIITEQFAIFKEAFEKSNNEISFSININFGIEKEEKIIATIVKIQFEQNKSAFLIIEISNHYVMEQNSLNEMLVSANKIIIPKDFAQHLVVITIGTIRGVLHAKTENTEFNQFVIPVIDVSNLIQNDVELIIS